MRTRPYAHTPMPPLPLRRSLQGHLPRVRAGRSCGSQSIIENAGSTESGRRPSGMRTCQIVEIPASHLFFRGLRIFEMGGGGGGPLHLNNHVASTWSSIRHRDRGKRSPIPARVDDKVWFQKSRATRECRGALTGRRLIIQRSNSSTRSATTDPSLPWCDRDHREVIVGGQKLVLKLENWC